MIENESVKKYYQDNILNLNEMLRLIYLSKLSS